MLFAAANSVAQTPTRTISGVICDQHNQPLPGVYVTNGEVGDQTNREGRYTLRLPAGKTRITTMYYSAYANQQREFDLNRDTTINFTLKEDALNMNEVVVTGTRTEKRLSETPVLTTLIKDREISKSGATSTLEALQDNIPGIVISPNAMGNNMRIKGLNSRYILFLVDGERLVSEGAGGNIDLDQIDVNSIDHIEVINGASSALYGSNAVGAVVNIITKKPQHKVEAGAQVIGESNNTWNVKADVGANLGKVTMRASGFRHSSDGFGSDGEGAYAASFTNYGANLKLNYTPVERLDLSLNGRYFRAETFNPEGSMNVDHPMNKAVSLGGGIGFRSRDDRNRMKLSINWDKYYGNKVWEKKDTHTRENTADYLSTRFTNTFAPCERFELVGGMEYNHEKIFSTKTLGAEPTTKSIDDVNLFAQADWEVFKNFDLVAGARYTYNEQFKSAFSPKLSLMYRVGGFKFRGGIGSSFRAPSMKELYYNFDHQGMFWVYGNPDLEAEKGLYTSLSVEYTHKHFNASLTGYYNDIDNKITQYSVINALGGEEKYYKNVSSAVLKGFDLDFSWIFLRQLTLKGTYSFCDARDMSTHLQLSNNVRHSATMSLTWNGKIVRSPFSLRFAGRVNSPIIYHDTATNENGTQEIITTESKTYSIWKVVLVKPFRIKKHTIEFTFKCDNIFGFTDSSFINPGRQYMFGLRYAFK